MPSRSLAPLLLSATLVSLPALAADTPAQLPPGATSTQGDKAATPDKKTPAATNPQTGSTAGMPPGTTSDKADKSETAKKKSAGKAGTPIKGKDGRVEGSREESLPQQPAAASTKPAPSNTAPPKAADGRVEGSREQSPPVSK